MTDLVLRLEILGAVFVIAFVLLLLAPAIIEHWFWRRSVRRRVRRYLP